MTLVLIVIGLVLLVTVGVPIAVALAGFRVRLQQLSGMDWPRPEMRKVSFWTNQSIPSEDTKGANQ